MENTCWKRAFHSEKDALDRIAAIKALHDAGKRTGKRPVNPYWCRYCEKYHITSMSKQAMTISTTQKYGKIQ